MPTDPLKVKAASAALQAHGIVRKSGGVATKASVQSLMGDLREFCESKRINFDDALATLPAVAVSGKKSGITLAGLAAASSHSGSVKSSFSHRAVPHLPKSAGTPVASRKSGSKAR